MNTHRKPGPTGMGVELHSDRASIHCEFEGARFHVWTDFALVPHDTIVFKNPPTAAKYDSAEHFQTRRLDSRKGQGKVVFDAMMAAAPALLPQAQARKAAVADAARARREQLHAEQLVREAAPELLAALQAVAEFWAGGDVPEDIDAAMRAAIAKATGSTP